MRKTVKIGEKYVEMVGNAASVYVYKQLFREDFLQKVQAAEPDPDLFQKMGFVFARQAESSSISDLMNMSIDDYYNWLSGFEALDVLLATEEISSLYYKQQEGTATPKNEGE